MFTLSHFSAPLRASVIAIAALAAPPALAQSGYNVTLAKAPAESKFMVGGTVFQCTGTQCTARDSVSSPLRVCTAMAKEHGPMVSFTYAGTQFDEAKLAKCNAKAAG